jgi:hypothetical protein
MLVAATVTVAMTLGGFLDYESATAGGDSPGVAAVKTGVDVTVSYGVGSAFATSGEIVGGLLGALIPGADVTGVSEVGGAPLGGAVGGWLGNELGGWLTSTPSAR